MTPHDRRVVLVKICGLTNVEDAVYAHKSGADLLGFVFVKSSPRCADADIVRGAVKALGSGIGTVGLFRNATLKSVVERTLYCGLSYVQLHGDETPEYCGELKKMFASDGLNVKIIKTFKVEEKIMGMDPNEYDSADFYLFDTYHPRVVGGTGFVFDWKVLKKFSGNKPFFVAGGLTPENVKEAVKTLRPYGVDVSSGVEASPGKKDTEKIKEFIKNAKGK